eukprot:7202756-Alexandrium_andersonii.AAC.1
MGASFYSVPKRKCDLQAVLLHTALGEAQRMVDPEGCADHATIKVFVGEGPGKSWVVPGGRH